MKTCAACGGLLARNSEVSKGFPIRGFRCRKCCETFWPASEMLRWEVLTGRRKTARKIGVLGDSLVVRIPRSIAKDRAHEGDYALFEPSKEGFLIRIVHAH
ncbi:hypothetical protein HY546_00040 [archaeon]|nr:hypothetical protein [archaeon]